MLYHIEKGSHRLKGYKFHLGFKNKIKFQCKFDKSCLYDLGTSDNYDVNKLYGFSTSWHHHKQSARVGWRCIDGENIQILTYSYNKAERQDPQLLGTVKPDMTFNCSIEKRLDSFFFEFSRGEIAKFISVKIEKGWFPIRYKLYPYFGGNITAPHDMYLEVNEI